MITKVHLPQLELTMENALVAHWHVKEGDTVVAEQILLEVETQKATSQVPSPAAGVIRQRCVMEGDAVEANALLCVISATVDEPLDDETDTAPASGESVDDKKKAEAPASPPAPATEAVGPGTVRATPVARKLAKDSNVDLNLLTGTGPGGRISAEDVSAYLAQRGKGGGSAEWTDLPPARAALIAQMRNSIAEIPQIVISRRLAVGPLTEKSEGVSFTHRLAAKVACALERHPVLRTVIDGRRTKVNPVSVAIAMDTAGGLVAPVLREEDLGSMEAIATRLRDLRSRADRRALKNDELSNGPFAVTNLGMLGVDFFSPLVFQGQTAVLAVGRTVDVPGEGPVAWFCLAVDHRIVDGAEAARFLSTLQEEICR